MRQALLSSLRSRDYLHAQSLPPFYNSTANHAAAASAANTARIEKEGGRCCCRRLLTASTPCFPVHGIDLFQCVDTPCDYRGIGTTLDETWAACGIAGANVVASRILPAVHPTLGTNAAILLRAGAWRAHGPSGDVIHQPLERPVLRLSIASLNSSRNSPAVKAGPRANQPLPGQLILRESKRRVADVDDCSTSRAITASCARRAARIRAKTKGKVERPFRYVREDFFLGGQFRAIM